MIAPTNGSNRGKVVINRGKAAATLFRPIPHHGYKGGPFEPQRSGAPTRERVVASNKKVLVLPGDGIGPEVMRQVQRVIDWFDRRRIATFDVAEDLVGGAAYDVHGTPLADPAKPACTART